VRIQVDDRVRDPGPGDRRPEHADEDTVDVRLEADLVGGIRPDHRDGAAAPHPGGPHGQGHVRVHEAGGVGHRQRLGVDDGHVVIVQVPGDRGGPVAAVVVAPRPGPVLAHDQRRLRRRGQVGRHRRIELRPAVGRRVGPARVWVDIGGHGLLVQNGRPVTGLEDRRVDVRSVGGQGPRVLPLDLDNDRRCREVGHVVDDDPVHLRHRDERPRGAARKDRVRRFVAGVQRRRHVQQVQIDDAHGLGDVVDDPRLIVRAGPHRHGIKPDGNRAGVVQTGCGDREDLEPVVRRVHGEQARPVGRQVEGADVGALPIDKRLPADGGRAAQRGDQYRNPNAHGIIFAPPLPGGQRVQRRPIRPLFSGCGASLDMLL
jgi:hypothetical protein